MGLHARPAGELRSPTRRAPAGRRLRAVPEAAATCRLRAGGLQRRAPDRQARLEPGHSHYTGPLDRAPLLAALEHEQQQLRAGLREADPDASIDWDGFPFSLAMFTGEFVQHEAIHHGQWSVYAALGGFDTPLSWRQSWRL